MNMASLETNQFLKPETLSFRRPGGSLGREQPLKRPAAPLPSQDSRWPQSFRKLGHGVSKIPSTTRGLSPSQAARAQGHSPTGKRTVFPTEKLDSHIRKHDLTPYTQFNSKWVRRKHRGKLCDISYGSDILDVTSKAQATKRKYR